MTVANPQPQPQARAGGSIGPAIVDGVPRYTSVSALKKADPTSKEGCLRKWYFRYVMKLPEETTAAMAEGTEGHAEIEEYLTTGRRNMSRRALAGMHMFPPPLSDMLVEHPLLPIGADDKLDLDGALLRADGIPIHGYIDLIHSIGVNYGAPGNPHDPEGTVELCDWKFTSSLDHAIAGRDLVNTIQMSGYGMYALLALPDTKHVRLSHGYMPKRGDAEKRTALFEPERVVRAWEHANRVGRLIREAARTQRPEDVEANRRACRAFGRPCTYADTCTVNKTARLASIIGPTAAERFRNRNNPTAPGELVQMTLKPNLKDLLRAAKDKKEGAPAATTPSAIDTARAKYPGLFETWSEILASPLGAPVLTDVALEAVKAVTGADVPAPSGELATYTLTSLAQVTEALEAIRAYGQEATDQAEPEAPTQVSEAAAPAPEIVDSISPPDAPQVATSTATEPPKEAVKETTSAATSAIASAAEGKKARGVGRPAGSKNKPKETPAAESAVAPESAPAIPPESAISVRDDLVPSRAINFYLNCATSRPTESLLPLLHSIDAHMREQAGGVDVRQTDVEALSYGKWRGALGAFVREAAIQPGSYSLSGVRDEFAIEFAAAVRSIVVESGGEYVVGA